ncbi:hypothetical protein GGR09_000241 [Bartonella heixiaziensis]
MCAFFRIELLFFDKKWRIFFKGLANSFDLPYVTEDKELSNLSNSE